MTASPSQDGHDYSKVKTAEQLVEQFQTVLVGLNLQDPGRPNANFYRVVSRCVFRSTEDTWCWRTIICLTVKLIDLLLWELGQYERVHKLLTRQSLLSSLRKMNNTMSSYNLSLQSFCEQERWLLADLNCTLTMLLLCLMTRERQALVCLSLIDSKASKGAEL